MKGVLFSSVELVMINKNAKQGMEKDLEKNQGPENHRASFCVSKKGKKNPQVGRKRKRGDKSVCPAQKNGLHAKRGRMTV